MNAIIIGSGIAGLTLASQIATFYDQVIIIDPHVSELGKVFRNGALQGRHLHVLLKKGQDIFFDFFPEFRTEFLRDCPYIDWAQDTKWESNTGVFPQYPSVMKTFSFSRGYLECKLVKAVQKLKNVTFLSSKVIGFITSNKTIIGVKTSEYGLKSDRVYLCGGGHFPLPRLLNEAGIKGLRETNRKIDITYNSQFISQNEIKLEGHKQYYYQLTPPYSNKGVVKTPIENGRLVITNIDYRLNQKLKKLDDEYQLTRKTAFKRKMPNIQGLVVLGDCLCSLNPVYGQGMTVAMMQVKEIIKNIKLEDSKLQSIVLKQSRIPWLLSNMAFQTKKNFINKYLIAFYQECQKNKKLHLKFLKILHLQGSIFEIINMKAFVSTFAKIK